jgi:hypothetical protein
MFRVNGELEHGGTPMAPTWGIDSEYGRLRRDSVAR